MVDRCKGHVVEGQMVNGCNRTGDLCGHAGLVHTQLLAGHASTFASTFYLHALLQRFICTRCRLSTLQGLAGGQADLGLGQGGAPIPEDRRPEQGRGQHQEDQEEGGRKVWVAGGRKVGGCSCQQMKGGG